MQHDRILKKFFNPSSVGFDLSVPFLPTDFLLTQKQMDGLSLARFLPLLSERGAPQGDAALRREIANDVSSRFDDDCKPEWVVTTNGSQQAIDLLMRCFDPGIVVTEEPGYAFANLCARSAGHRLVSIPYNDSLQIDWALWQQRLQIAGPDALVYIMPRHSNPAGRSFSESEIQTLTSLLKNHRGPVVHDGWMDEVSFNIPKKFSRLSNNLIRLGSMTKKLFPGARVGYVVIADEALRERLISLKRIGSGSVSLLSEKIVCEVFQSKLWSEHIETLSKRLHENFQTFSRDASAVAQIQKIEGGILCWVQPHKPIDIGLLNSRLLPYGLSVRLPSQWVFSDEPGGRPPPGFSICFPRVDDKSLSILRDEILKG